MLQLALGPGAQPALSSLSDKPAFSCYIMLNPFPEPLAFTMWSWWESALGAKPRKGPARGEGTCSRGRSACSPAEEPAVCLLSVVSSCSQLSS